VELTERVYLGNILVCKYHYTLYLTIIVASI
jgi:hypothetical protein